MRRGEGEGPLSGGDGTLWYSVRYRAVQPRAADSPIHSFQRPCPPCGAVMSSVIAQCVCVCVCVACVCACVCVYVCVCVCAHVRVYSLDGAYCVTVL